MGLPPNFSIELSAPSLMECETEWSPEVDALLGYRPGDKPQTIAHYMAHLHPDDAGPVWEEAMAAIAEGRSYRIAYRVIRPDGSAVYAKENGFMSLDPDGQPGRLIGTVRDITAQVETWRILKEDIENRKP